MNAGFLKQKHSVMKMERYISVGAILVMIFAIAADREADGLKMKIKMIHRHSTDSPFYTRFASNHDKIQELLRLDSLRIRPSMAANNTQTSAAAASPADSNTGPLGPASFAMPVASGATLGAALYFVELYIGTPPQRVLLVADTGSDLIWVNCDVRSTTDFPAFGPDNSSSLSYVPCYSRDCYQVSPNLACIFRPKRACEYSYGYLDNSTTTGPYIQDTITLESSGGIPFKAEKIYMGCGTNNLGQSAVSSGGVLGLGQGFNSFATQTSHIYGTKFSYCLADYLQPTTAKTSLVFGDQTNYYSSSFQNPIQYTPILKGKSSFYHVGVEEITVDGEKLPISSTLWEMDEAGNGGTIIDSGTSLTYFAAEAYDIIMESLRSAIAYSTASTKSPQRFDLCFNTSGISNLTFPEFSICLTGGNRFTVPAENYMLEIEEDVRCVGFNPLEGQSIIGNLLQQNFFVEYDLNQSLLGFAAVNCSIPN